MKLIEPAIYKILLDGGVEDPIYIGIANSKSKFPLVLIQRISTEPDHVKDMSAISEDVTLQITSASNQSLIHANDLDEQIFDILNNLSSVEISIIPGKDIFIRNIFKDNNNYFFEETTSTHHIQTDYIIQV